MSRKVGGRLSISGAMAAGAGGGEGKEEYVYRISTAAEWGELQSSGSIYGGELDKKSGFIHLSNLNQVTLSLSLQTHAYIYRYIYLYIIPSCQFDYIYPLHRLNLRHSPTERNSGWQMGCPGG